eukprot:8391989-Pyramimonas_sp.AAC.1
MLLDAPIGASQIGISRTLFTLPLTFYRVCSHTREIARRARRGGGHGGGRRAARGPGSIRRSVRRPDVDRRRPDGWTYAL